MTTHECLVANTLNCPKLRLAYYELQDSLALWPAAGQVVPAAVGAPCGSDADADRLLNLCYDLSSDLVARFGRTVLNIDAGEPQSGSVRRKSTSLRISYTSRKGLT